MIIILALASIIFTIMGFVVFGPIFALVFVVISIIDYILKDKN